jgi:hypothetical protein
MKTQYAILSGTTAKELEDTVNQRLAKGWKVYGNLFFEKGYFYQAVVYEVPAPTV